MFLNPSFISIIVLEKSRDYKLVSRYLNGAPISASSRVKMINDFGWVIMDIGSVSEDL